MRPRSPLHLTALAATLALAVPSVAAAQHSPDPDSPAGVEYALPLDRARDQAREKKKERGREGDRKQGSAKKPAPLFGAGITKDGTSGGAGSDQSNANGAPGGGSSGQNGSGGSGSKGSASDGTGADEGNGAQANAGKNGAANNGTAASVGDGGSQTGLLLGVVAGVLLLGGLLGAGLRRGFGRSG